MTAIVGFVENGTVYMGGDSAAVRGDCVTTRTEPKVFRVGDFLIGYTTSFRMGQLLQYGFSPPDHPKRLSDHAYLCTLWVDSVRELFRKGGFLTKEKEGEEGGTFLVGYRGALYEVDRDYQVGRPRQPYAAVGSGEPYALGALTVATGAPVDRVRQALAAAELHCTTVRGPFIIESLGHVTVI